MRKTLFLLLLLLSVSFSVALDIAYNDNSGIKVLIGTSQDNVCYLNKDNYFTGINTFYNTIYASNFCYLNGTCVTGGGVGGGPESDPYYYSNPLGYYNESTLPVSNYDDSWINDTIAAANSSIKNYVDNQGFLTSYEETDPIFLSIIPNLCYSDGTNCTGGGNVDEGTTDGDILIWNATSELWESETPQNVTIKYKQDYWAEENGQLNANTYEWAFGNGAENFHNSGIILNKDGKLTDIALKCNVSTTATVEIQQNKSSTGCQVSLSSSLYNTDTCNVDLKNGAYIQPFTTTYSAGGYCVVTFSIEYNATADVTGLRGPKGESGDNGAGWSQVDNYTTTEINANITGDLEVSGIIGSRCGPYGVFSTEKGTVASNLEMSFGNGQTPTGAPQVCDGTVVTLAAMCSGAATASNYVAFELIKNGASQTCDTANVNALNTVFEATSCGVSFSSGDILNCKTKTMSGTVTECVCTFWVKYT